VNAAAYGIIVPAFRNGVLTARTVRHGNIFIENNHFLFPAIAVNAQGKGAIVGPIVGPTQFPSVGYVPIDAISTGSTVTVIAPGHAPQDGFTGYDFGVSRWGDYSSAFAAADGAIWISAEYIPDAPRTELANWGTYLQRIQP
jgi:hypothetical protein